MKKSKALVVGAIVAVVIAATSVTVFAASNGRGNGRAANNPRVSCSELCNGTGQQNCILKEDCPYFNNDTQSNYGKGQGRCHGRGCNRSGSCA